MKYCINFTEITTYGSRSCMIIVDGKEALESMLKAMTSQNDRFLVSSVLKAKITKKGKK